MGYPQSDPPSDWAGAEDAGGGVYYLTGETQADIIVWHWCLMPNSDKPRWLGQAVPLHTLVTMEPLHLEPSLACADDCGWHGYLRGGVWTPV